MELQLACKRASIPLGTSAGRRLFYDCDDSRGGDGGRWRQEKVWRGGHQAAVWRLWVEAAVIHPPVFTTCAAHRRAAAHFTLF